MGLLFGGCFGGGSLGGEPDDAALEAGRDRLGSVAYLQLAENILHVVFHGVFRDPQGISDELIGKPFGHFTQHLDFSPQPLLEGLA